MGITSGNILYLSRQDKEINLPSESGMAYLHNAQCTSFKSGNLYALYPGCTYKIYNLFETSVVIQKHLALRCLISSPAYFLITKTAAYPDIFNLKFVS